MSAAPRRAEDGKPSVYARLAQEAGIRAGARTAPRGSRLAGWVLCLALLGGVVAAALRVHPW